MEQQHNSAGSTKQKFMFRKFLCISIVTVGVRNTLSSSKLHLKNKMQACQHKYHFSATYCSVEM